MEMSFICMRLPILINVVLGLYDLNYTCCHFTWSNGNVSSKLDRVLVNPLWSTLQRLTHVHFGNQGAFSDHSPAVVRLDHQVKGHRSFKFFNMWGLHDKFLEMTTSSWSLEVFGSSMFVLCCKLKRLKLSLKEFGKLHFSHISERVNSLEDDLRHTQNFLQVDRDNSQLLENEKSL